MNFIRYALNAATFSFIPAPPNPLATRHSLDIGHLPTHPIKSFKSPFRYFAKKFIVTAVRILLNNVHII